MKKILTILTVFLFISQGNALQPDMLPEKAKLPESLARQIRAMNPDIRRTQEVTHDMLMENIVRFHQPSVVKNQKVSLDSIIEIYVDDLDERQVFLYDGQGRIATMIFSEGEGGQWEDYFRYDYTYYPDGLPESNIYYTLNDEDELLPFFRYLFIYDDKGNVTLEQIFLIDDDGEWELRMEEAFTYDDDNNILTAIMTMYVGEMSMPFSKEEYTYDNQGNNTRVIYYASDFMGGWDPESKEEYTYTNNALLSEAVYSEWDDGEWVGYSKDTYTYDGSRLTELITQYWEEEQWINRYKEALQYSGDRVTQYLFMIWDEGQWVNDSKDESTWDGHGNMTSTTYYEWEEDDWLPIDKMEVSYNTTQDPADLLYPYFWYGEGWDMVTGYVISDWEDGAWQLYSEATFYWSGGTPTSLPAVPYTSLTNVYPNPASDLITISADVASDMLKLFFYDTSGRMVFSKTMPNHTSVSVSHLNQGIYMLIIQSDHERVSTQKLIVR